MPFNFDGFVTFNLIMAGQVINLNIKTNINLEKGDHDE
jgi:hypothetical protein